MGKAILFALSSFVFGIFGGCASTNVEGTSVSVSLASNPTTGARWTARIEDTSVAVLESDTYEQDKTKKNIVGAGGTQTLTFRCKKEGETTVEFVYGRPWNGGETWERRTAVIRSDKNLRATIEFASPTKANHIDGGAFIFAQMEFLPAGTEIEFDTDEIYENAGIYFVDLKEIAEADKSLFNASNEAEKGDVFLDTSNRIVMFLGDYGAATKIKGTKIGHINESVDFLHALKNGRKVRFTKTIR